MLEPSSSSFGHAAALERKKNLLKQTPQWLIELRAEWEQQLTQQQPPSLQQTQQQNNRKANFKPPFNRVPKLPTSQPPQWLLELRNTWQHEISANMKPEQREWFSKLKNNEWMSSVRQVD